MRAVRTSAGGRRVRKKGRSAPVARLPGLRWVPVPLALLAVVLGLLVMGTMQGQAAPAPADPSSSDEFTMPDSEMPGMQPTGDDRLRVEVDLNNISGSVQKYATTDFTLTGPGGKTWQVNGQEHSSQPASANLQPGFATTIDMYWDIPASDAKENLTIHWSRGGRAISLPVNTGGEAPTGMHM